MRGDRAILDCLDFHRWNICYGETLAKIAGAMDLALSQFFSEGNSNGRKGLPQLSDDEVRFLSQMRRYSANLNDSDRKLVLAMVKKMASSAK